MKHLNSIYRDGFAVSSIPRHIADAFLKAAKVDDFQPDKPGSPDVVSWEEDDPSRSLSVQGPFTRRHVTGLTESPQLFYQTVHHLFSELTLSLSSTDLLTARVIKDAGIVMEISNSTVA